MEIIIIGLAILQIFSISLGVGSSTLAVLNFFVAIADGTISEEERNMMGIVYIVLRIAMVAILFTTTTLALYHITALETSYMTPFKLGVWAIVVVLFVNAYLMTKRLMPSTFGPAIQAGSWYTLGIITALFSLNLEHFTYLQFFTGYATMLSLAVIIINGVMLHLKHKAKK